MLEKEFVERIQELMEEFIKNDQPLKKEEAKEIAKRLFMFEPLEKDDPVRKHHQTVRIQRDEREWVPVTIYFETDETGKIDLIRIHSRRFIEEFRQDDVSS